ncbi:DEAD/DEAH box helicase [Agilicoccus flavus]|uniref:DEAD/DEAH box helicase n=1 Tax=Agilicoccus flavus TaxID=2775968 RepID=UPI001CF6E401|nr:DEAD/DEAH box helicase [Agilicoccus flavus]
MSSPAERYARSKRQGAGRHPRLAEFETRFDFPLDDFQTCACAALEEGRGVLVAAPTGAGKTIVGEFAVHLALAGKKKAFYTTPIKALSNQKYADLVRAYGPERIGLLTGDSSINSEAPVVVMTTEVLRNMMYAGSDTLRGLGYVVMDEVHYLADRFRGPVWEEVIIHLPDDVQVASLSATVSNAEEFGAWLEQVRGATEIVVTEHRPVPLWQHMLVGSKLFDLFVDDGSVDEFGRPRGDREALVNPDLVETIQERRASTQRRGRLEDAGAPRGRRGRPRGGRGAGQDQGSRGARPGQAQRHGSSGPHGPHGSSGGHGPGPRPGNAGRAQVVDLLDRHGLLPAITFIFSRAGCEAAVGQLLAAGLVLVDDDEADAIRALVETRVAGIAAEDLGVLGYWDFLEGLCRGFGAHHAGMLPVFREIVEELFTAGRIRAVFATETLALGINMPARTVVLEKLVKFNGETHADITPAEYTQLTGRAGRRGIDVEGHAVVLWHPGLDPLAVGGLASTRTYPLRSSFRPTYNMAVNLVGRVGRERARDVLESSFAQFQADASVVGIARQLKDHEEAMAGYEQAMTCHLGDFAEYAQLRHRITTLEKNAAKAESAGRRAAAEASLDRLTPGDVVWVPEGRRAGRAVVVATSRRGGGGGRGAAVGPQPGVVTEDGRMRRLTGADLDGPVDVVGRITLPKRLSLRNAKDRRDLAATMRAKVPDRPPAAPPGTDDDVARSRSAERVEDLRRELRAHPCHRCPDREQHARWSERWWRLERETAALRRKMEGRTNTVARTFDRICALLDELGYLGAGGTTVTDDGRRLARLYTERDLLAAQCLRHGAWEGLDGPGLAAVVSCLIYEPRREDADPSPRMPDDAVERAHEQMVRLWSALEDLEGERKVKLTDYPDPGMAWMIHRWASGARLETVLRDSDLSAGDFVRRCKQTVDLLDQIGSVAGTPGLRRAARDAVAGVMRGVVAADRLD